MQINGSNRRLGFKGESRAVKYLKNCGYNILKRNFKCKLGEVDVIAQKGDIIVFTEVKTRTGDNFGSPSEAVDLTRQKRYINCARYYFGGRQIDCTVRFDVIEVTPDGINHIENAFEW